MLLYRDQRRKVPVTELTRRLRPPCNHSQLRDLLIDFGLLESGVADAVEECPLTRQLRATALELGRLFYRSAKDAHPGEIPCLEFAGLPERVNISVPEGYAYYGLYPESYIEPAECFLRQINPAECICIGIRSIGTSLSAVVAGTVLERGARLSSITVRPTGHPFDRRVRLPRGEYPRDAYYLIVDEGPGLSGSSFGAAAEALSERGIPDSHIVLFPSWKPNVSALTSANARDHFARHPVYPASEWRQFDGWADLSAGRWRCRFYSNPSEHPPFNPQHERRKYLKDGVLAKFAGFGERGRFCFERARELYEAGFSPKPLDFQDGFLFTEFVNGRPAAPAVRRVADYLAFIHRTRPSSGPVRFEALLDLIRTNVSETLGTEWMRFVDELAEYRSIVEDAPSTNLDGRMLPHEWIETSAGFLKTDAVDHGDDHFFPGPQNIAWDVAAAKIELILPPELYARVSGDRTIIQRLPFYITAYTAFRLGYFRFFESADPNFPREARRYETFLKNALVTASSHPMDSRVLDRFTK
jgi:hypothetical protein